VALGALAQVLDKARPLDEALAGPALARLAARDRAFARNLVATCLRRLGQIDALIDGALDRPLPPAAAIARHALRLGAAQLAFLDTPPHAAVSTAVALVEPVARGRFKGLVNAVLRAIGRAAPPALASQDAPRLNTPDWLWQAWRIDYGEAVTRAIAAAHLSEAPLDLTVKDPASAAEWADRLGGTVLATGTVRLPAGGPVTELPGFAEGAWWVQDAGAALPARLLGDVAGRQVLDLCAAPGGKAAQLAAAGARLTALDRSDKRLARVADNLSRLGLSAELVAGDGAAFRPDRPADAVLLDAPCTSTGTIRRHPDVAHIKSAGDVHSLAQLQARLLDNAVACVRPGGILVYATCSLEREEGETQIDRLLVSGAPVARVAIEPAEIGGWDALINERGEVRALPCHLSDLGGIDGFFIARLRRTD
jgi:16S rRNA (cytosine967-C5)-methyltransferase